MNIERLLKLADYLDNLQVELEKDKSLREIGWKFSQWFLSKDRMEDLFGHPCQTVCCAVGNCAFAFPEEVQLTKDRTGFVFENVIYDFEYNHNNNELPIFKFAKKFFDLTRNQADILFVPSNSTDFFEENGYKPLEEDGKDDEDEDYEDRPSFNEGFLLPNVLVLESKPKHVAENIRKFVELKGRFHENE